MLTCLDLVLDANQQAPTAQVDYTARGRHSIGFDIQLNGNYNFDSRIRTLFRVRCISLGHHPSTLVPKPG